MSIDGVLLARHGETDENAARRFQGHRDPPLNERGRAQARALGGALAGHGIRELWSSPLRRALQTAEIAGEVLGLRPRLDPGSWRWTSARGPGGSTPTSRPTSLRPTRSGGRAPPRSASRAASRCEEQGERVAEVLAEIAADAGKPVLVVCHGGVIREARRVLLGCSARDARGRERLGAPPVTLLARLTFAALVVATFGAFFVTQRLKRTPPPVNDDPARSASSRPTPTDASTGPACPSRSRRTTTSRSTSSRRDGDRVRRLADGRRAAAPTAACPCAWDGRDDAGRPVRDGTYRYRVALRREGRTVTLPVLGRARTSAPPRPRVISIGPTASTVPAPEMFPNRRGEPMRVRLFVPGRNAGVLVYRTDTATPAASCSSAGVPAGDTVWTWDGTGEDGAQPAVRDVRRRRPLARQGGQHRHLAVAAAAGARPTAARLGGKGGVQIMSLAAAPPSAPSRRRPMPSSSSSPPGGATRGACAASASATRARDGSGTRSPRRPPGAGRQVRHVPLRGPHAPTAPCRCRSPCSRSARSASSSCCRSRRGRASTRSTTTATAGRTRSRTASPCAPRGPTRAACCRPGVAEHVGAAARGDRPCRAALRHHDRRRARPRPGPEARRPHRRRPRRRHAVAGRRRCSGRCAPGCATAAGCCRPAPAACDAPSQVTPRAHRVADPADARATCSARGWQRRPRRPG